ncbi:MAG: RNA polymerase sigma factor [Thermoguttaceae bacterium]|nr:RNA polymerase sigma factor [Thermoguttaceae bacterium]
MKEQTYIDDSELVERFRNGDRDIFDVIDRRYRNCLVRFFRRRSCSLDLAEDLAQETLVRALRSLDSLRDGAFLSQWLYRIAYNNWIDWTRKNSFSVSRAVSYDELALNDSRNESDRREVAFSGKERRPCGNSFGREPPDARAERAEAVGNIWRVAQDILTDVEFRILWAKYVEERGDNEIAEAFRKKPGNVRVLLTRIRKKLVRKLRLE